MLVPGTGVILNNMLGEEDLNPLGFHRIAPGRRVPSMMAPTVVLRDGEIVLGVGSAGSNRIRSAILQTVVRAVEQGLPVAAAIEAPRLHFEARRRPGRAGDRRGGAGAARGARASRSPAGPQINLFFGGVQAVARDPRDGCPQRRRRPPPRRRRGDGMIDFEAEGLLDDLDGEAREARLALLRELAADGVPLEELREAVAAGRLALLPVERALAGDGRRYTARESRRDRRHRPRAAAPLQRRPRRSLHRPRRAARRPRPTSKRRGG